MWLWPAHVAGQTSATEIPETLFIPKSKTPGIQLVQCFRGYLLQHWGDNLLLAEAWFPELPNGARVGWFCRSQGLSGSPPKLPAPVTETLSSPWSSFRKPLPGWVSDRRAGIGWVIVALALVLFTLPITSGLKAGLLADDYTRELEQARVEASELLAMRGQARRDAYRYRQLQALLNAPKPLESQWLIANRLPADLEYEVIQWERQGDSVELVIQAEVDDSFRIVRALTGQGITGVTVEPWRREGHHVISLQFSRPPADILGSDQTAQAGS